MTNRTALILSLLTLGCSAEPGATVVDTTTCQSGLKWTSGDKKSTKMYPGRDCNECHERKGGPVYGLAGTVYSSQTQLDDCFGTDGAIVELHDSSGGGVALTANAAGNFWASRKKSKLVMPYTVTVKHGGRALVGRTEHTDVHCAGCHTESNRVLAP